MIMIQGMSVIAAAMMIGIAGQADQAYEAHADDSLMPDGATAFAESIVSDAMTWVGTPYVYGGTGPSGFDCSGLVCRVFSDNGVTLPRTVTGMMELGSEVAVDSLLPGDLLIFDNPRHVGIFIGDGQFIHSSSWQGRGVVITPLAQENYSRRFTCARRVI